jgi:2-keto-3-deoxy-L-rhamnonate aldolase RhmA
MGAFVGSVEQAAKLVAAGYRYLAVSGDITLLGNAAKTLVATLRERSRLG